MKDLKKKSLQLFRSYWPLFIIVLIVCVFFWKVFVLGYIPLPGDFIVGVYYPWLDYKWGYAMGVPVKNPITTDVVSFTYPMQMLAISLLKEGGLPLWNSYILSGSPLLANFQSAPFSPTNFVYFIFDKLTAWSLQIMLQHVLAAIFTYLLLRHWKVSKLGSMLGGIIFAFSGYNIIFSLWNGHALAASFIPLILLFEDRLLGKGRIFDGLALSIFLALQIFAGYTQTSLYTVIAVGILWLVKMVGEKKILVKTLVLAIFCFIALGLSSVQIFPSYELIVNSQRDFEPYPYEWTFLPWKKVITFVAPDYFGNHVTRNYWGPQDYTSNTGYVGVVAFVLATVAFLNFRKNKIIFFLLTLLTVSLILSFATPLSVFLWSANVLGMHANSAHRATVLFCMAVALLAGFGFDLLTEKIRKYRTRGLFLFPAFFLISFFIIYAYLIKDVTAFGVSVTMIALRNLILPTSVFTLSALIVLFKPNFKVLLIPLTIFELFYFGFKYTPFSPRSFAYPDTPILTFFKSQKKPFRTTGAKVIPSNLRMAYGIEAFEGYDTFHPLGVSRFIAAINTGNAVANPTGRYGIVDNDTSPLLDLVNVKYYIVLKADPDIKRFDKKRFKLAFNDQSVDIFESKSVLPRAFMVYDWETESEDTETLETLLTSSYPFGKKIVLLEDINCQKHTDSPRNSVGYEKYEEEESLISVNTQEDGLLFVSDSYYPGWKAYVDGKETKILRADFAFRAIPVPAGTHEIRMVYQPASFYNGLKISGASALLLLLLGIIGRKRERRYT